MRQFPGQCSETLLSTFLEGPHKSVPEQVAIHPNVLISLRPTMIANSSLVSFHLYSSEAVSLFTYIMASRWLKKTLVYSAVPTRVCKCAKGCPQKRFVTPPLKTDLERSLKVRPYHKDSP